MKIVYIVLWTLTQYVTDPCPDAVKTDEYGRTRIYGCAVNHGHLEEGPQQFKVFDNREEATRFADGMSADIRFAIYEANLMDQGNGER